MCVWTAGQYLKTEVLQENLGATIEMSVPEDHTGTLEDDRF